MDLLMWTADLWLPFKLLLLFYRMDCVVWLSTTCSVPVPRASEGTNTNTHHLFSFCLVGGFIWADRQMLPLVFRPLALALCSLAGYVSLCLGQMTRTVRTPFNGEAQEVARTPGLWGEASLPGIRGRPTEPRWWSWQKAGVASNKSAAKNHPVICVWSVRQDICKSLWCHRTGHRCETKFMPAAEGTTCGPDMVRKNLCMAANEYSFIVALDSVHWCECFSCSSVGLSQWLNLLHSEYVKTFDSFN